MNLRFGILTALTAFLLSAFDAEGRFPVERHYRDVTFPADGRLEMELTCDSLRSYDFEVVGEIKGMMTHSPLGKTAWWLEWYACSDSVPYMRLMLRWGCSPGEGSFEGHFMQVDVERREQSSEWSGLLSRRFSDGVNIAKGSNGVLGRFSEDGILRIYAGKDLMQEVGEISADRTPEKLIVSANRKMNVKFGAVWFDPAVILPIYNADLIDKLTENAPFNTPVGVWEFMDRDTDGVLATIGGKYALAVIPHQGEEIISTADAVPAYDIVYLGGGEVNSRSWSEGMLKGHLYPTPFEGHFALRWLDSMKEDMGDECTADLTDNLILSMNFPLFKSKIRFVRVK